MRFRKRDAGHKAAPVIEDVPFFTQGPSQQDPTPIAGNNIEQLQKAERVLGITHRQSSLVTPSNARQRGPQPAVSAQEPADSDLWSKHTEQEHQPMDTARSANGGLKPWPSLQSKNNYGSMHDAGGPSAGWTPPAHSGLKNTSHQNHISHEPSDSTLRSHYEASNQPLAISQQTSASAVRDMGLRKVKSGANSSRNDVETSGRQLKSALKHPSHEPERMEKSGNKKEGMRFPKWNILPRHAPSNRDLLQPSQLSQYGGSSLSVNSTNPSNARAPSFSHSESLQSPAPGSISTDSTTRPKVFESDVFDSAKVHVRRPPKGIQNWFDVDNISSDEEQNAGEALPSTFSPYQEKSYQRESRQPAQQARGLHSSVNKQRYPEHDAQPEAPSRRSSRQPTRPVQTRQRNISDAFVEENAAAIDLARQRMQATRQKPQPIPRSKRESTDSFASRSLPHAHSIMSGAHSGMSDYSSMRRDVESSRLAHSRGATESELSSSDNEEDLRYPRKIRESVAASSYYSGDVIQASPVSVQRPSIAPRPVLSKRANTRESTMTTQTSGSIPIHWSDDTPMPPLPRRATQDSVVNHTSEALRRLIGREPSVRTRSSRPVSSRYESEGSVAGETIDSMPSDISRMMAVTEEEMALLEMMRLKRAAMQKGEISEATQQILKREQEQLLAKQQSAQQAVQKLQKAKEERQHGQSEDWAQDLRPDYERIAGLGALREEDVDEKLRIERFLASETPLEDVFPFSPFPISPDRNRESSVPREPAPMEDLLLPRTYTPQPENRKKTPSPAPPRAPSTVSGADESDVDESAQLAAEMRDFLGGDGFGSDSAFPMPPKSSSRRTSRRVPRTTGMLAPALPSTREEELTPPIPARSPNRMPCFNDGESVLPPGDRTTRLRADSGALDLFPPTIATQHPRSIRQPEPPTPSDASERLSAFLGPSFEANFDALDMTFPTSAGTSASHSSNARYDSPSICTSQASPLTPTFPTPLANDKTRGLEIASNDMGYLGAYDRAEQGSLRSAHSAKVGSQAQTGSKHRQSKISAPASQLEMLSPATFNSSAPSRKSNNGSCMSASDDVLAAWAELGGVSEGLSTRSRSPMRSR